jgi:hypothetical protein
VGFGNVWDAYPGTECKHEWSRGPKPLSCVKCGEKFVPDDLGQVTASEAAGESGAEPSLTREARKSETEPSPDKGAAADPYGDNWHCRVCHAPAHDDHREGCPYAEPQSDGDEWRVRSSMAPEGGYYIDINGEEAAWIGPHEGAEDLAQQIVSDHNHAAALRRDSERLLLRVAKLERDKPTEGGDQPDSEREQQHHLRTEASERGHAATPDSDVEAERGVVREYTIATVRRAKADALREAADEMDQFAGGCWTAGWLRERADRLEKGDE